MGGRRRRWPEVRLHLALRPADCVPLLDRVSAIGVWSVRSDEYGEGLMKWKRWFSHGRLRMEHGSVSWRLVSRTSTKVGASHRLQFDTPSND